MKPNNFVTQGQMYRAAEYWYGNIERDNLCRAENRLMKGEVPHEGFYIETSKC